MIDLDRLGKSFAGTPALAEVSLAVKPGELVALLGPQGAGKTTSARLVLGLLRPSTGSARVCGLDPAADGAAVRRRAGYLPESPGFHPRIDAWSDLAFLAAFHGLEGASFASRAERVLRELEVWDRRREPAASQPRSVHVQFCSRHCGSSPHDRPAQALYRCSGTTGVWPRTNFTR